MIRDATVAGPISAEPLLARVEDLVDTASAAILDALDDSEKHTAHLYLQTAAQAAEETWQQIAQSHIGPSMEGPAIAETDQTDPTSQGDDDVDEISSVRARRTAAPGATVSAV